MSASDANLLDEAERQRLLRAPRPKRRLPLVARDVLPATHRALELPVLSNAVRPSDERTRPIYAVWELTLACDLACRHCGSRAGKARQNELSTEECLQLIEQMADLDLKEVTLIGGEAYLRGDWLQIVRAIRKRGMQVSMTTGGRGVTFPLAQEAKEAGLQSVSVSIDGDEEVHDRLRGMNGAYAAAVRALRALQAAGVRRTVNSQINRLSVPHLHHIVDLMIEHGANAWQLIMTVPMGRAADEPEVLLQPQDLLRVFPLLAELKERCEAAGILMLPGNNVGYFGPFEHQLRSYQPAKHSGSCGAGSSTLGIEADGAIKGCPSLPTTTWTGGNVRSHSLQQIWERSGPLRFVRDRTVEDLWGYCRQCYYAESCKAGCTWTSFVFFGRSGNNPYCHHRALHFDALGQRERLVRKQAAPGTPFDHGTFDIVVEDNPTRFVPATSEEI